MRFHSPFARTFTICAVMFSAAAALIDRSLAAALNFILGLAPAPKRQLQIGAQPLPLITRGIALAASLQQSIRHEISFRKFGAPRHV